MDYFAEHADADDDEIDHEDDDDDEGRKKAQCAAGWHATHVGDGEV